MGAIKHFEQFIFQQRKVLIGLFALITCFMAWSLTQLKIDAGFTKLQPMQHEYMQVFSKHQQEFSGANRVLIALVSKKGDIFNPQFFDTLNKTTDAVFFLQGVDRARVSSLFTPNVRYTEVVEDGITGESVIPADFKADPAGLQKVRENILKANIVGRLVANDFSAALISVQLQEINPETGKNLDYITLAKQLEEIRQAHQNDAVDIHIIGFAKAVGDIADGAERVGLFFIITLIITILLTRIFTHSWRLTLALISCALIAVIWQLGLLPLLGYGIDPMSILIPFLIFAIAVSHGVQMVNNHLNNALAGLSPLESARLNFQRLLIPSSIALLSDTLGFITIYLIKIQVIQEMAITASIGVAVIIVLNLILLPLLLSFIPVAPKKQQHLQQLRKVLHPVWHYLAQCTKTHPARIILTITLALTILAAWQAQYVKIGDLQTGVPELRADSVYNRDTEEITRRFSIGVDVLNVIVETKPDACIDHNILSSIDDFAWTMRQVPGVQSVLSMPDAMKMINAGWNQGNPKWQTLPRNPNSLSQSVSFVPTSTGLLNPNCSVMPVMIFTEDHKADTIKRVVQAVKDYRSEHQHPDIQFKLATGNVGVMAASNEEIDNAQFPILIYLFTTITALCFFTFKSSKITLCIMLPLGFVSLLAYALMAQLAIGLKVATLPVVALGVGVGVDYGIYIYSRLAEYLKQGIPLYQAYRTTLDEVGAGVVFTALTLAVGVFSWIFSPLKFQADMGILLTFLFMVNMLAAIVVLPALASWMRHQHQSQTN